MAPSKDPVPTIAACEAAVELLAVAANLPELVKQTTDKLGEDISIASFHWRTTRLKIKDAEANEKTKEKLQADKEAKEAEEARHAVRLTAMEKRAEAAELALGQAVMRQAQTEQELVALRKEMEEMRKVKLKRKATDAGEEVEVAAPVGKEKKKR